MSVLPIQDGLGKRWRIRPHDAVRVARLEESAGIPAVVAQLLLARGIADADQARGFLDTRLSGLRDPDELPGVPQAVDCIYCAMEARRRIVVYGDYDADGMTATALVYRCLKLLGGDVGYHLPSRLDDGYGLSDEALAQLKNAGASLVVTVDCGITSTSEALTAEKLGIELVVTDHHEPGPELPRAAAIVHPRLPGHRYPFGDLCGAAVAFKLAWALCRRASQSPKVSPHLREFLLQAVGLAALGTVADVVPLLDENRILVHHGLIALKEHPVPGLAALMTIAKLDNKKSLGSEDIAFTIGPRLNAAGRLGQAQLGVELLTTDAPQRSQALAEYIDQLNGSRDSLERSVYLAANKQIGEACDLASDAALVLSGRGWHAGVIGLVAGRLAEKHGRPVIVLSLDQLGAKPATGSMRSAGGLHACQALAACGEYLVSHGGHAAAAGLRIDEAHIDAFRAAFLEHAATAIDPSGHRAELRIDGEAPFGQLTLGTVQKIELMAPFGAGNPRPVLFAGGVELAEPPKKIGSSQRHLSLKLRQDRLTLRAVAFGQADWAEPLEQAAAPLDVAFRPVINDYRGRHSVELHLVDWRMSPNAASR
jgi:single-stranded-DNA-specific exonuclease